MGQFKPMPKEATTEPSVELKLKKGGRAKHMAEGGESRAEHKAEMAKMGKIERELKAHEAKRASKGHAGLKKGGNVHHKAGGGALPMAIEKRSAMSARPVPAVAPARRVMVPRVATPRGMVGLMAEGGEVDQSHRIGREGKPHSKTKTVTGNIELSGYKSGGTIKKVVEHGMVQNRAGGGSIKPFENTKMVGVTGHKGGSKTGDIERSPFKKGGHAHKKHHYAAGGHVTSDYRGADTTKVVEASGHRGGNVTGGVEGSGYKHGGHVSHQHSSMKHHSDHGHKSMQMCMGGETHGHKAFKAHAHGGKVHGGKVAHKAKGGKCW